MSVNDRFAMAKVEQRSALTMPDWWMQQFGATNSSGQSVTEKTVFSIGAVAACVRVISQGLATMPFKTYQKKGGKINEDLNSSSSKLSREPNPFMTWFKMAEYMTAVAVLKGNSYAYIFRDSNGNAINLLPLQNCQISTMIGNGELFYKIVTTDPIYKGIPDVVPATSILHIKGLCTSSIFEGVNPIQAHAQTFGIDLAAMDATAKTFKSGSKKWMLASENSWKPEQMAASAKSFDNMIGGESVVMTVPSGVTATQVSLSPSEAGYLESMQYTDKDIARIFGVPASMIGADDGAIKASVEQDALNFLQQTLAPWAKNFESEWSLKILTSNQRMQGFYPKFNFNSLLRADASTRAEFYSKMINIGVMSPNEARAFEELNPYEGGDVYLFNQNQIPFDLISPFNQAKIDAMDAKEVQNNNPNGKN